MKKIKHVLKWSKKQVKCKENQNMQPRVPSNCIQIMKILTKIYFSVTSIIWLPIPNMAEHVTNSKYLQMRNTHTQNLFQKVGLEKVKKTIKLPNNNVGEGTEKAI